MNGVDPTGLFTVTEVQVTQFVSNLTAFGELFSKVRALCKGKSTIEQVNEILFYSNIAMRLLTLSGVSLFPFQAEDVGGFKKVGSGVKAEVPLIDVSREGTPTGHVKRFTFGLAGGAGLKGGVKFGFELQDNPLAVEIGATWPPPQDERLCWSQGRDPARRVQGLRHHGGESRARPRRQVGGR